MGDCGTGEKAMLQSSSTIPSFQEKTKSVMTWAREIRDVKKDPKESVEARIRLGGDPEGRG